MEGLAEPRVSNVLTPPRRQGAAFVLWNHVGHRRFLPAESHHAFSYRTISLLVSLDDLEHGRLDLGWVFRYGSIWPNVCGIRPSAYLTDVFAPPTTAVGREPLGRCTIRERLGRLLSDRGWDRAGDVWMQTMPSFLGFEGINPLTVYYVYQRNDEGLASGGGVETAREQRLWLVVLEVHNTFGEKHVYVLQTGEEFEERGEEDLAGDAGVPASSRTTHRWVFPRQFHVSPFNDRSGFYRCVVRTIPPPSSSDIIKHPLRPSVKLELLTSSKPHPRIKLVATIAALTSAPLSPSSLISHLAKAPFALLTTFPRIAYQASVLHFRRRLDVYARPEPVAKDAETERKLGRDATNPVEEGGIGGITACYTARSMPIGWQPESFLERWARKRTERFLKVRVDESGGSLTVILVPANPATLSSVFSAARTSDDSRPSTGRETVTLTIWYRSPRFFTILLMAPSPYHALLLGSDAERLFTPSSRELFLTTFAPTPPSDISPFISLACKLRLRSAPHLAIASKNALDETGSALSLLIAVALLFIIDRAERVVFLAVGARFVPGGEPWNGWGRLGLEREKNVIGSVRRPP